MFAGDAENMDGDAVMAVAYILTRFGSNQVGQPGSPGKQDDKTVTILRLGSAGSGCRFPWHCSP
jgi:hypothetical protein